MQSVVIEHAADTFLGWNTLPPACILQLSVRISVPRPGGTHAVWGQEEGNLGVRVKVIALDSLRKKIRQRQRQMYGGQLPNARPILPQILARGGQIVVHHVVN